MSWHQNPTYDRAVVKLTVRLTSNARELLHALQLRQEVVLKQIAAIDAKILREKQNS